MALVALLQEWITVQDGEMLALTVDHGLRAGSAAEALQVQNILRARGVPHEILTWEGDKPATHLQERAREARYKLLLQACRQRGFSTLAVAHNLEDQIETFWMRLAHGSGLNGLAAMASRRTVEGVSIVRPLLGFSRAALRATCEHRKIQWIEDPSNSDTKYLRVKLRPFEALLESEGLTQARLAQTIQKLEDAREALQAMTDTAMESCVRFHPEGYATLTKTTWAASPRDIQRRVLAEVLKALSPEPYPVGFEALEQARLELLEDSFAGKTLSGCDIFPGRGGDILLTREAAAVQARAPLQKARIWDGRFILSGFGADSMLEPFEVGTLGENGLSELRKNIAFAKKLESMPAKVKRVLPALWQGGNLLAVPSLSYYRGDCPEELKAVRIEALTSYRRRPVSQ